MNKKPKIIWIDKNIYNQENQKYLKLFQNNEKYVQNQGKISINETMMDLQVQEINNKDAKNVYDFNTYDNIVNGIKFIKGLQPEERFKSTFIIVSGSCFKDFVNEFNKHINDIYVIPKIIIFTSLQKKEIIKNEKVENDNFYKCGGIHTDFDKIKKFIDDKQEEIINYPSHEQTTPTPIIGEELIFEQVNEKKGILMQLFYKIMIEKSNTEENNEFMNFLRENYLNDPKYKDILSQIVDVSDIPVELLSKYYARIYTINGNFYKNMKKELLKGNEENYKTYLPFIKTLFEGTRKKALKTCFQIDLYSAQWLAQMEIDIFKNMSQIEKGNFVRKKLLERHVTLYANVALGVASACLVYIGFIKAAEILLDVSEAHQAGYICSMLFVIPGFPLITGGIDLAKLDLRSGFERILYALLIIFVATITGWLCAYSLHFSPAEFVPLNHSALTMLVLRILASFAAVFGFSLMFNSTVRMAATAGIIGTVANVLRLELLDFTGIPLYIAAFIAALTAGLLASASKRITGFPRLTVTVPSIVITVPGLFMYKGIYFFALEDITTGGLWLAKAALVVCSLSLGLIFARILTDRNFRTSS